MDMWGYYTLARCPVNRRGAWSVLRRLRPQPDSFTEVLQGLHKEIWPDPDAWLEEERSTWE